MKNFFLSLLLLTMTVLISAPKPVASEEIKTPLTIEIVTPQWENQTNKDGSGLFFDIIKGVYEPAGITMTYHFVPWKRAQFLVKDGHADAMLCVWKQHADEENQIIPHYPMFVEHTAVIFLKDSIKPWEGIKSIDGKSAVWLRGYDYHLFKQFNDIRFKKFHEVDSYEKAWRHMDLGRYEVYIDALIDIDIYINANAVDMNRYQKKILWGEKAYIAFSKTEKSKKFISIYDERIKTLFETGRLKQIYDTWGEKFYPEYWME